MSTQVFGVDDEGRKQYGTGRKRTVQTARAVCKGSGDQVRNEQELQQTQSGKTEARVEEGDGGMGEEEMFQGKPLEANESNGEEKTHAKNAIQKPSRRGRRLEK